MGLFDNTVDITGDNTVPSYEPTFLNSSNNSIPDLSSYSDDENIPL